MVNKKNKWIVYSVFALAFLFSFISYNLIFSVSQDNYYDFEKEKIDLSLKNVENSLEIYVSNKKLILDYIVSDKELIGLLKEEKVVNKEIAKMIALRESNVKIKEFENYLESIEVNNLEDIKKSDGFRERIVKKFGKNGYTGLIGPDLKFVLHPNKDFEGKEINEVLEFNSYGEVLKYFSEGNDELFVEYEINKSENRLAMVRKVSVGSENQTFYFFTSVLPKNYLTINGSSSLFSNENFGNKEKVYLVSKDGYLLLGDSKYKGINLFDFGLIKNFPNEREGIIGPIYNLRGDLIFIVFESIYENDELLGYVFLELDANELYDLILGQTLIEDTFMVSSNGFLISPYNNLSILSHSFGNEEMNLCLERLDWTGDSLQDSEIVFQKNKEKFLLGSIPIYDFQACLFMEMNEKKIQEDFGIGQKRDLLFSFLIFILGLILLYFLIFKFNFCKFVKKEYLPKNKFLDKINKINDFEFIMTSLIIIVALFFILNYFFFIRELIDFGTEFFNFGMLFCLLGVLKYSLKYKRNVLFVNSLLVIIFSLVFWIILHYSEIIFGDIISTDFWAIPITVLCVSLISLMFGARRLKK